MNTYYPIAQMALEMALEDGEPAAAAIVQDRMNNDLDLVKAKINAFDTASGMKALQNLAVKEVLKDYGDAIGTGRTAIHVPQHTRETIAMRIAMKEQKAAELNESIAADRDLYAQLTLDTDLENVEETVRAT